MDRDERDFGLPEEMPTGGPLDSVRSLLKSSWNEQLSRVGLTSDYINRRELRSSGQSAGWTSEFIGALGAAAASLAVRFQGVASLGTRDYGRGDIDGPAVVSVFLRSGSRHFKVLAFSGPAQNGSGVNSCWPITMVREVHEGDDLMGARVAGFEPLYRWDDNSALPSAFWYAVDSYDSYLQLASGLAYPNAPYWRVAPQGVDDRAVVTWVELMGRAISDVTPTLGAQVLNSSTTEAQGTFDECLNEAGAQLTSLENS